MIDHSADAYDHAHTYFRVRRLPVLIVALMFKVGLGRFAVTSGTLPHHSGCTATEAVLEQ